ncbi:hypothetical protein [Burkholderia sp. Ax-1719]|uniref:hypothetical protein n=1 Tax=Burkholderia sp. Ax-1719 TaxID=2608334 RepID=UPI00141E6935|nr:hypothetical protein [Burkholderia sp. Ax-1719]NIE67455.1 hypothetical protein [Burkholderia sp. Ax-1719]
MIDNPLRGPIGGLDIAVNPALDNVPRMQTSPKFAALMPPEFVAELNDWMHQFFGTENLIYQLGANKFVMGPKNYALLRARLAV